MKIPLIFILTFILVHFNSFGQQSVETFQSTTESIYSKYKNTYEAGSIGEALEHNSECGHLLINVSIDKKAAPIALSADLGKLGNLIKISVHNNKRIIFPNEIGNLLNLESLEVVSSPLQDGDVPIEIRNCENLKIVMLDGDNEFTIIPQGLLEINKLQFLIITMGESVERELLINQLLDLSNRENKTYIIIKNWDRHVFAKMKMKRNLKNKNIAISFT